jgi:hypothetical protein
MGVWVDPDLLIMPKLQGIWSGLIGGTAVQTLVLAYLTMRCDWDEEVHNSSFFLAKSYSCHNMNSKISAYV